MNQSVDKLGNSSGVGVDIEHEVLGKLSPGTHILEHLRMVPPWEEGQRKSGSKEEASEAGLPSQPGPIPQPCLMPLSAKPQCTQPTGNLEQSGPCPPPAPK